MKTSVPRFILVLSCAATIICSCSVSRKALLEENARQQQTITSLQARVDELNAQVAKLSGKQLWLDDGFNYLAIGNSLTQHGLASYWWDVMGMAASVPEKDYYHLVCKNLKNLYRSFLGRPMNFGIWEVQAHDRDETWMVLDKFLSPALDLITIQLGENVGNLESYESDFVSLLGHIKEEAPRARILVIGDFWASQGRDEMKKRACDASGVEFISLDDLKGVKEYQCGMHAMVHDAEGKLHEVLHEGVAAHPGDKGMEEIAGRVINAIRRQ